MFHNITAWVNMYLEQVVTDLLSFVSGEYPFEQFNDTVSRHLESCTWVSGSFVAHQFPARKKRRKDKPSSNFLTIIKHDEARHSNEFLRIYRPVLFAINARKGQTDNNVNRIPWLTMLMNVSSGLATPLLTNRCLWNRIEASISLAGNARVP